MTTFSPGDQVICVDDHASGGRLLENAIYEVLAQHGDLALKGLPGYWSASRFRMAASSPFKPGDRVICLRGSAAGLTVGSVYTIIDVSLSSIPVTVRVQEITSSYWDVNRFKLSLSTSTVKDPATKAGDLADWKTWAKQGQASDECPCRIKRASCTFHS